MPVAYQHMTLNPNESSKDFVGRVVKAIEEMPQRTLKHRPLPQNSKILTFRTNSSLQYNTELWKDTCPMCRSIVTDLKVFCMFQLVQSTFHDENIFICWNMGFSRLASAIMTRENSVHELEGTEDVPEEPDQNEGIRGNGGIIKTEEQQMKQAESGPLCNNDMARDTETGDGKAIGEASFCQFCAYFACLMFDYSIYQFSTSCGETGDFGVDDRCCMQSMADSKIGEVAKKLLGYSEKFGQEAEIEYIIQPIDYDPERQHFSILRFQAYSRSPTISNEDLFNILGMRRELVLEVYSVLGELHFYFAQTSYYLANML
jgi:hypothetical protein